MVDGGDDSLSILGLVNTSATNSTVSVESDSVQSCDRPVLRQNLPARIRSLFAFFGLVCNR